MNDFKDTDGMGFSPAPDAHARLPSDKRCVRCGRAGHRSSGCDWPVTLPDADTRVIAVGLPVMAKERNE